MAKEIEKKSEQTANKNELVTMQLNESIEMFKSQFSLLIQILTVFVVANVTILGFAVSNQISGIALVGATIPIMMLIVITGANKFMLPVIFTAISLETKYSIKGDSWLITTFIQYVISEDLIGKFEEICEIENPNERIAALRKERFPLVDRRKFRLLLLSISLLQIAAALILYLVFGWRFV